MPHGLPGPLVGLEGAETVAPPGEAGVQGSEGSGAGGCKRVTSEESGGRDTCGQWHSALVGVWGGGGPALHVAPPFPRKNQTATLR